MVASILMLTVSSIAVGNALRATCYYRQKVLVKSIGTCTNNHTTSIHILNSKDIASKAFSLIQGMLYA